MTLWLPLLNYGRSYAPLVAKIGAITGPAACVQAIDLDTAQIAALRYHGQMQIQAAGPVRQDCPWLITEADTLPARADRLRAWGWQERARLLRPTDNDETLVIFAPGTP